MKQLLILLVLLIFATQLFGQTTCTTLASGTHSEALTWTQSTSPGITGNKVYCSLVAGGPYTVLNSFTTPSISFTQASLPPSTKICYVVTAINAGGESNYSNEVCGTTLPDKPVPPVLNPPIVN